MSRGDITAGRAFVELFVKRGAFEKGLADAQAKLRAFGQGLQTIGTGMLAMGAAISAPLVAALHHFESTGSALNDMAARTGASVEALGQLGYAAEQTGASIEDVETAIRKSQKAISAAAGGSKESQKAFRDLGINYAELAKMNPDDQFDRIATAIGAIQDPTTRAAVAVEMFGKSGTKLLPMIADLNALKAEAEALGSPTTKDAELADQLGDSMGRLKTVIGNVAMAVGGALAPSAIEFLDTATGVAKGVIDWVRNNGELIKAVAKVAAGLTVVGGIAVAIGTAITGGLGALSLMASVGSTLAGVLGLLANPAVLVVAAIGALGVAVLKATGGIGELSAAMGGFKDYVVGLFGDLSTTFNSTWKGIVDAVSGGDLQLAAQVAWAGLKLAWEQGTQGINKIWQDAKWYFLTVWNEATSGIAKGFIGVGALLKAGWIEVVAFFEQTWNTFVNSAVYQKTVAQIAKLILYLQKLTGDLSESEFEDAKKIIDEGAQTKIDDGAKRREEIEAARKKAQDKNVVDTRTTLNELDRDKKAEQTAINVQYNSALTAKQKALDDAKAALKLKTDAAAGVAATRRAADGERQEEEDPYAKRQEKTVGTFSAAAAYAMGGGGGSRVERKLDDQTKQLVEINKSTGQVRDLTRSRNEGDLYL